jgi:CubicO group peptidase (beta-lactamase class C family)
MSAIAAVPNVHEAPASSGALATDSAPLRVPLDATTLKTRVDGILNRHAAVGLALGVVRGESLDFYGHGVADIARGTPITEDTVFRVASLTKLFTAIAIVQLAERGRIELDAPANDYLRAYQLIPTRASFRPATVRHLLTHTAGIPEVTYVRDLAHPDWGDFMSRPAISSVKLGERLPSLAEYYKDGLRITYDPGRAFQYCNHGFATLGQIVEDVTGQPLDRYFREHIFEPLGMPSTDLVRSELVSQRLATGYMVGSRGAERVVDRDWVAIGGGNIYSSTRDLARFATAVLRGGRGVNGSILEPKTLAAMFVPSYQPDPRLPGVGLSFFTEVDGGHRVVDHDGVLPGFNSRLVLAPDDGVAIIALTNGSSGAFGWLPRELDGLLHGFLGIADHTLREDIPQRPEVWADLAGVYSPRFMDVRGRSLLGVGLEVLVRGGRLVLRALTPIPALYRGVPLHPDSATDPYAFRIDLSRFDMGTPRVVFSRDATGRTTGLHTDTGLLSFDKRDPSAGRTSILPALAVGAAAFALLQRRRGRERSVRR